MVNSNTRKLALSGWLKENSPAEYESPLKLQKFLFLYEAFSKVSGNSADFDHLCGYLNGTVFSNVWGDYTHDRAEFDAAASSAITDNLCEIDIDRAKKTSFILGILSESDLSEFTHKLNIWGAKSGRILSGEKQVRLSESDFTKEDHAIVRQLMFLYPDSFIDNTKVIRIDNHYFLISKSDFIKLTEEQIDILPVVAESDGLRNPIYVEIDEEGRLIID